MRCPKCGYTSFDHLESCKKCGKDLAEFKERFGIKSVLFPGQMRPGGAVTDDAYEEDTADAAVAAATGVVATAAAVTATAGEAETRSSDSDDFGFDFMGDSAEDDDLSFDELFEEAPEDEDVEETIEAPKEQTESAAKEESAEGFSFDLPDEEDELDEDFGFDPTTEEDAAADPDSDAEESFSFDDEASDLEVEDDDGNEGDPKSPFDLPESSVIEGAPEKDENISDFASRVVATVGADPPADLFGQGTESVVQLETVETYVFEPPEPESKKQDVVSSDQNADAVDESGPDLVPPPATESSVAEEPAFSSQSDIAPLAIEQPVEGGIESSAIIAGPPLTSRIGAFVCDLLLLAIVGISFIVAAEAAMSTESAGLFPSLETLIDLSVPYFLVLFSLAFGYFTLFHFLAGQTPGKMLAGLRVETTDGEPLAFGNAFLRSVGGLLQLLPAGLGYLAILTSAERRGWNDRLAGTRVVYLKDLPG
jgi:uncharacterized RDD family membrane protein YckC